MDAIGVAPPNAAPSLRPRILRLVGNELRKMGRMDAIPQLQEAASMVRGDPAMYPATVSLLARAHAHFGDSVEFSAAIRDAKLSSEAANVDWRGAAGPIALEEIELRGLLSVGGDVSGVLRNHDNERSAHRYAAPQWQVIHDLTVANALLAVRRLDEGAAKMAMAVEGAEKLVMPHQVQRAIKALERTGDVHNTRDAHVQAFDALERLRATVDGLLLRVPPLS
jgi:hypothetical protein